MASVTINFSTEHAVRIQSALEQTLMLKDENGDPRPATVADLKTYIVADVRQFVRSAERREAARVSRVGIDDVDLT